MEDILKIKGITKADLLLVATELGEDVSSDMSVPVLRKKILGNEATKEDPLFVKEYITSAVTERKLREQKVVEERKAAET